MLCISLQIVCLLRGGVAVRLKEASIRWDPVPTYVVTSWSWGAVVEQPSDCTAQYVLWGFSVSGEVHQLR